MLRGISVPVVPGLGLGISLNLRPGLENCASQEEIR
jgi:hypothetical protein